MSTPPSPRSFSHYDLESLLGRGGMGTVYRGRDRRDGTPVAIKLLHPHLEADDTFKQRFEREAHYAALLRSPYTVHLLDYGFEHGTYFIAMEFVDGRSLRDLIRDDGPLDVQEAVRIGVRVARALEEAEARGVVHRDIKPDNIMLSKDGAVKVSDFGIARQLGSGAVTMPGAFVGTLVYAAPEIARGEADHRSDIYSLGATLYDALTGRPPFQGAPLEVLRQHADEPVPADPLSGVPPAVRDVTLRCMAKNPNDRYQSASALAAALEETAHEAATAAQTPPAAAQTPPPETAPVDATEVMRPPASEPEPTPEPAVPPIPEARSATRSSSRVPMSLLMGLLGAGAAAIVAVVALLVLGGGGSDDDGPAVISDDDLARMMLTSEDLRPAFSDFAQDTRLSGPVSNEDLIANACDPTEVTAQVEREERLSGYESVYRPAQVSSRAIEIRSRVDQYETQTGASGALVFYVETQANGTGELACSGITVADASEFDVPGIGDEARGVQSTRPAVSAEPQTSGRVLLQTTDIVTTAVVFALGDMLGRVEIDGDPGGDYQGLARDLAEKLDARMAAVLEDVEPASPTPRPSRDGKGSATPEASVSPGASGTTTPTATPTPPGGATPTHSATAPPTAGPTNPPVTAAPTAAPTNPPTQAPQSPTINSVGCPNTATTGQQITCQPSISGTVTSRSWSAPGGSPASGNGTTFSTSYNSTGSKTITLTACNGSACANRSASVTITAPTFGTYAILIDSVFDAPRNTEITVGIYAEVPALGMGYWDVDVEFDTGKLTYQSCQAFIGECGDLFSDEAITFTGEQPVNPGFVQLGTVTFRTGSTPGFAYLDLVLYGIEDNNFDDVFDNTFVESGGITIQ